MSEAESFRAEFAERGLTPELIERFRAFVFSFYEEHGRHEMVWRHTTDPYLIVVSEIMLQQTQVPRVEQVFPRFIERFPTAETLARASEADVLKAWQGMGYNRRALNLQRLCRVVTNELGGIFPQTPDELVRLPGIGPATSGSIAAFAFNAPVVFIETNVRRIFIHSFFEEGKTVDDAEIYPLAAAMLPKDAAREWYWALMDLGTELKRSVPNPNRRSRQYTKQAAFEGSNRQVRGEILRRMLAVREADAGSLAASFGGDEAQVTGILEKMTDEGFFVREENGRYRIV